MSRDYKGKERPSNTRRRGSSLLAGILIGLVLGLAVALAVAWYVNKMPTPFATRTPPSSKAEPVRPTPSQQSSKADAKQPKSDDTKPRFDFYKILPGNEEPTPQKSAGDSPKTSTASGKEAFFLQAGAFQSAPDADNMKARLALLGVEANVETASLPDKGVLHRVRIGPYTSVEELNRTRDTLKQNGVQTTLIKARESER